MIESSALPHRTRPRKRTPSPARPPAASSAGRSKSVEIVAPDRYCAELLLRDAARLFSAELVPGRTWGVRVQPPAGGEGVLEVLALVVHWLDSIPLPCAKVFYGDGSFLLRAGIDSARHAAAAESAFETATEAVH